MIGSPSRLHRVCIGFRSKGADKSRWDGALVGRAMVGYKSTCFAVMPLQARRFSVRRRACKQVSHLSTVAPPHHRTNTHRSTDSPPTNALTHRPRGGAASLGREETPPLHRPL